VLPKHSVQFVASGFPKRHSRRSASAGAKRRPRLGLKGPSAWPHAIQTDFCNKIGQTRTLALQKMIAEILHLSIISRSAGHMEKIKKFATPVT
jgi:hypothetical protein